MNQSLFGFMHLLLTGFTYLLFSVLLVSLVMGIYNVVMSEDTQKEKINKEKENTVEQTENCKSCGHTLKSQWRICPYCGSEKNEEISENSIESLIPVAEEENIGQETDDEKVNKPASFAEEQQSESNGNKLDQKAIEESTNENIAPDTDGDLVTVKIKDSSDDKKRRRNKPSKKQ